MTKTAYLTDSAGNRVATLKVDIYRREAEGVISERLKKLIENYDYADGVIVEENLPETTKQLILDTQELIDGQVFSLLDEYQDKIDALNYKTQIPPDETLYNIVDLQIYDLKSITCFILKPVPELQAVEILQQLRHELEAPIATIWDNTRLLFQNGSLDEQAFRHVGRIQNVANTLHSLKKMIDDYLGSISDS